MRPPAFRQIKDEYAALWRSMIVKPDKLAVLDRIARKLIAGKPRYQAVAARTGVPWPAIALIHQMECGGDWSLNIAQGDPWNKRSVHVPKGRGPFNSWEDAAIDALAIDGTDRVTAWSIERLCYELEKYNGFGSRRRGIHTPYLWSTSNHYTRGKYVADHVWDANAVSAQAGAMPLLSRMMALDASITIGEVQPPPPDVQPAPVVIEATKPLIKSKTLWASLVAGMTTAGSAFTAALADWRVWCAVVVLALLAYVVWERNGKPDIRGLVR
jgi:lysozyme family protein